MYYFDGKFQLFTLILYNKIIQSCTMLAEIVIRSTQKLITSKPCYVVLPLLEKCINIPENI